MTESRLIKEYLKHPYLPILLTICIAIVVVFLGAISQVIPQAEVFTPRGGGTSSEVQAGFLNALVMVLPAALGGSIILYLFRKGKIEAITALYKGLFFLVGGLIFYLLGDAPLSILQRGTIEVFPFLLLKKTFIVSTINWDGPLAIGIYISGLAAAKIFNFKAKRGERNGALIIFAGIVGGFIAVVLPTWTVLIVLILLSVYDIYSVFFGPIKEIIKTTMHIEVQRDGVEEISPSMIFSSLTFQGEGWDLGIGDLVFYSLLSSHSVYYGFIHPLYGFYTPFLYFIPVLGALLAGFYITERLLQKYSLLPGLPIPMGMGVIVFTIMWLLFS